MSQLRRLVFFLARSKKLQKIRFLILLTTTYCNQSDGEGQDYCWSCDCLPHQGDPDHQRAQVLFNKQSLKYFFLSSPKYDWQYIIMLFRKMEDLKLISTETLRDLIHEKFERMPDYPKTAEEEDPLAKVCLFSFNILENLIPNPQMLPPTVSIWLIIFSPCYNIQGEFEVIKQLVGSTAGAAEAKRSEENLLSSH